MRQNKIPTKSELSGLLGEMTLREIRLHYGISQEMLMKWVKSLGLTRKLPKRPSREELDEFLGEHTHKEAQQRYGVKSSTFERWLMELGLQGHRFSHKTMKSLAFAAKELNVSRMTVSIWFRQGLIPGAKKLNSTRVSIPDNAVNYLRRKIEEGALRCKRYE